MYSSSSCMYRTIPKLDICNIRWRPIPFQNAAHALAPRTFVLTYCNSYTDGGVRCSGGRWDEGEVGRVDEDLERCNRPRSILRAFRKPRAGVKRREGRSCFEHSGSSCMLVLAATLSCLSSTRRPAGMMAGPAVGTLYASVRNVEWAGRQQYWHKGIQAGVILLPSCTRGAPLPPSPPFSTPSPLLGLPLLPPAPLPFDFAFLLLLLFLRLLPPGGTCKGGRRCIYI